MSVDVLVGKIDVVRARSFGAFVPSGCGRVGGYSFSRVSLNARSLDCARDDRFFIGRMHEFNHGS
jgi:hypothetical protein